MPVPPIIITKLDNGSSHHLKINHSLTKDIGLDDYISSPTFRSGGFDWEILYFPQLDEEDPDSSFISFSLTLESESWDVRATFDFSLLEKDGSPSSQAFKRTSYCFSSQGDSFGYARFISRAELEDEYLIDGYFTVLCTIFVTNEEIKPILRTCGIGVPGFDLHDQFGKLWKSGEKCDVSFEVEGEKFNAHKLILAARSPVFEAELFGSMAESKMKCIKINDMKSWVFKALLGFIYTDTLCEMQINENESENVNDLVNFTQHLLVAADRYGIEGLRVICEEKLCNEINLESVVTTLDLAERHNCEKLKEICLGFISVPKNLMRLALTQRYVHLMQSCPVLLTELQERVRENSIFHDIVLDE
ncbi:hypothetical protein LUZ60_002592 [Juncus effusus]|nr:hypothetical protein LUZ60_002592 [Juncus effusus]